MIRHGTVKALNDDDTTAVIGTFLTIEESRLVAAEAHIGPYEIAVGGLVVEYGYAS